MVKFYTILYNYYISLNFHEIFFDLLSCICIFVYIYFYNDLLLGEKSWSFFLLHLKILSNYKEGEEECEISVSWVYPVSDWRFEFFSPTSFLIFLNLYKICILYLVDSWICIVRRTVLCSSYCSVELCLGQIGFFCPFTDSELWKIGQSKREYDTSQFNYLIFGLKIWPFSLLHCLSLHKVCDWGWIKIKDKLFVDFPLKFGIITVKVLFYADVILDVGLDLPFLLPDVISLFLSLFFPLFKPKFEIIIIFCCYV